MNTPRINPNDPKWTAYVLGELGEAETEAIEHLLATSAEARALVDELEAASAAMGEALATESPLHLTPAQRAAIRKEAAAQSPRRFAGLPLGWVWGAGALATAAAIVAVVQFSSQPPARVTPEGVTAWAPESVATPETKAEVLVPDSPASMPQPAPSGAAAAAARPPVAESRADLARQGTSADTSSLSSRSSAAKAASPSAGVAEGIPLTGSAPSSGRQGLVRQERTFQPEAAPVPSSPGYAFADTAPDAFGRRPSDVPERPRSSEAYAPANENTFVRANQEPLATFSIDVDTASYSNVRRFLNENQLPPADAVRIEELINYFTYDYPHGSGPHPIGASLAVTSAPWNARHRLVRVGVRARDIDARRRPASNLVFLIDVSGSMNTPQKLPLVKSGLKLLVDQLGENDRISIVVYASATGLVLRPTPGDQKDVIARALDNLEAGGSTNGGAGIQVAYEQATANFIRGGTNRVILVTDGDFNVGITRQDELTRLIESRAKSGVFLSVLGFGMGNLKDATLERLADQGNGHYAYIDSLNEARKVLVEEMSGTLVTVAKDVKIQVDFNPSKVDAYRLIGYENRALRPEDFNNDLKDAGDMGAGHTVTALFEVVPPGVPVPGPSVDPSVFQPAQRPVSPPASNSNELLVLRVRYKRPDAATSTRMDVPLTDRGATFAAADADFRFAASVAAFGMILKGSPYRGDATLPWVLDVATASRGTDRGGYRGEFIALVQKAIGLQGRR